MQIAVILRCTNHENGPTAAMEDLFKPLQALELPEQYRQLVSQLCSASIDGWTLLNPKDASEVMQQMREIREQIGLEEIFSPTLAEISSEVRPVYWSDRGMPVFAAEPGLICLDLDPAPNGSRGQVTYVSTSGSERKLVAGSLDELADKVAKALKDGDLVWSDPYGRGQELCCATGAWGVLYGED